MSGFALLLLLITSPACAAAGSLQRVTAEVLDTDGKPIADAVVFAYEVKVGTFAAPSESAIMDQVRQEFAPRLLAILVGTSVRFPNQDNIHHHLYSFSDAKRFELPLYRGEPSAPIVFDKPGVVKLGCNIHDRMSGIILVLPNPYFATTDALGKARLEVPPGEDIELAVFHERLQGPVALTRKRVPGTEGPAALSWRVKLKKARPSNRPALAYP